MQKIICFLLVMFLALVSCKKSSSNKNLSGWLEGKVIRISCASYVIQISNNSTFGQDNWKNIRDNKEYDNVVSAANQCEISQDIKEGDKIRFRLDFTDTMNECVVCDMFDGPPTVVYGVKNISVKK